MSESKGMHYSLGDLQDRLAADREARIAEFKDVAASKPYQDAMIRFGRVTDGFIDTHRALSIYTWRQRTFYENTLMYAFADDFLESAVGIATGIHIGTHHAARRELRYMLENAVKALYVDQQKGESKLHDKVDYLTNRTKVPRGKIDVVDDLALDGLDSANAFSFRNDVKEVFGTLSSFVHPSERQLERRLTRSRQGIGAGFDTPKEIQDTTRLIFRTYDLILVMLLHGIGLPMAGDLFINVWDTEPGWPFHRGRFTREVSRHFDYKVERQQS